MYERVAGREPGTASWGVPLVLMSVLAGCASTANGRSQDAKTHDWSPKDGFYVAGFVPYHQHGHDDEIVAGGGSAEFLPELDSGHGGGVAVGARSSRGAIEFNYQTTDHDAASASGFDSRFFGYNLDFKVFLRQGRVQPLILLGIGAQCVEVEDGSGGAGGEVDDAVFEGLGIQLGGGIQVHVSPRVSFFLQGGYRYTSYDSVDGVVDGDLGDEIDDAGAFAAAGVSFTF